LKERSEVNFKDIKEAVISVLSHRIKLKPSVKYLQRPDEFVKEQFCKNIEQDNWEDNVKGGFL
jgi:hypothetical protein